MLTLSYPVGIKNTISNPIRFKKATIMLSSNEITVSVVFTIISFGGHFVKSKLCINLKISLGKSKTIVIILYSVPFCPVPAIVFLLKSSDYLSRI